MKRVTAAELATIRAAASQSPRRRQNSNLHPALDDPVQRLLNAFEPGSYVRPHRHTEPGKWELFIRLAGSAAVLTFDGQGTVQERIELGPALPIAEIPPGTWHTLAALESGTVLFEVKPGPYTPLRPEGFAPWAPADGTAEAGALELWFRQAQTGDRWPS